MKPEKNQESEKKKETIQDKTEEWIDKAEEFMDETAEKMLESDFYRKADQSVGKASKKIFRKAGRWWGKSERYLKNQNEDEEEDSK